ncbi:MAG: leucine-rich repeat protein, partial [Clostridia bacterium]
NILKKRGMSLIVLVITILVMIILAGVVIVSLSKNNPIDKAKEAIYKSDIASFKQELSLTMVNEITNDATYDVSKADVFGEKLKEAQKYIPSFTKEYDKDYDIIDGELVYKGTDIDKDSPVYVPETSKDDKRFKMTYKIDAPNTLIQMPLTQISIDQYVGGVPFKFDYVIDWGDGTPTKKVTAWNDPDKDHIYALPGKYQIKIEGILEAFSYRTESKPYTYLTNEQSRLGIISIDNFGEVGLKFFTFLNAKNLTQIAPPNKRSFENMIYAKENFQNTGLVEIPENFFYSAKNLKYAEETFEGCPSLTRIPATLFHKNPKLESVYEIFGDDVNIQSIPDKIFSRSTKLVNVTDAFKRLGAVPEISEDLFANCPDLKYLTNTFKDCTSLKKIPAKLFSNNTQILNIHEIFKRCENVDKIPVTLLDNCPNIEDLYKAFDGCTGARGPVPELWKKYNISNTAKFAHCFQYCTGVSNYDQIPADWK